jgi:energy-coupling factor transporter ATP-binding protein EcfA2
MKPREAYKITTVRVVEFHNLGTTTIEVPEGGHLFLLGDNGSGKTTILDAIHLVLSAGREMEFNAAARVTGAKDSGGRTFQGVVLRYNAVTGRAEKESGITYAALELTSATGKFCSLAVGISATGLDVAYERWGGIAATRVADLPLTIRGEDGRERPATQGEFKRAISDLPGGRYYTNIGDYADAVGDRLFGGEQKYADVCKLLRTGKAYREIAARAANYNDLFRQLLEEPRRDTFEPLLKGLRELEESKGRLEQIDERAKYLRELQGERQRLQTLRLKRHAIDWAEADGKRRAAETEVARCADAIEAGEREKTELEGRARGAKDEVDALGVRLQELRAKDNSGLIAREKSAVVRSEQSGRKAADAKAALAEEERKVSELAKREGAARAERASNLRKAGEAIQRGGKTCGITVGGLVDELFATVADGTTPVPPVNQGGSRFRATAKDFSEEFSSARTMVSTTREAKADEVRQLAQNAERASECAEALRAELDESKRRGEVLPDIGGFANVREEIRSNMLRATSLYELLEPAPGCDTRHVALIERLAGEEFLATWLVAPQDADAVRRVAWRTDATKRVPPMSTPGGPGFVPAADARERVPSTPSLSVAVRGTLEDVNVNNVAPWLGKYISFEESDVEAVKLLALHLAAKTGPEDGDFLGTKMQTFRLREGLLADAKPRLIGRKFRAAEQARRERELEARLSAAEKESKAADKALATARTALDALKAFAATLDESERSARLAAEARRAAATALEHAEELKTRASLVAEERLREYQEAKDELEDIRLKMRAAGIDGSLERRIEAAEKAKRKKEAEYEALTRQVGVAASRLEGLAKALERWQSEASAVEGDAARAAEAFAGRMAQGEAVESFVARLLPERGQEGFSLQEAREKAIVDTSASETKIEQKIRAAAGEAYLFSFDRMRNRISDRRGVELDEVLADESRRLAELNEVISQKNREVFERIFMGDVMRRLYEDLMRITDLAKRIQRKLAGRRFGSNRYDFSLAPEPEYEVFVGLVRRGASLGAGEEKDELRDCLERHRDAILNADIGAVPPIFDYRNWFRFELKVLTENEEGRVIDRRVKSMGSGGEQAVPNYLLILTVAEFLYHGGDGIEPPKAAPILFDEAFYGIDAARRDQLLAFADDLGLQLFVSSPDQDGVKREIRHSVSLIVIKDENLDVHLSPVVWRNIATQDTLLGDVAPSVGMTVLEETR